MTPLTRQLIITGGITVIVTSILYYVVSLITIPLMKASLECNKTCLEHAGDPMPTSGLLLIVVILIAIGIIIGVLWFWGDFPKEEWDELVKGKKE